MLAVFGWLMCRLLVVGELMGCGGCWIDWSVGWLSIHGLFYDCVLIVVCVFVAPLVVVVGYSVVCFVECEGMCWLVGGFLVVG